MRLFVAVTPPDDVLAGVEALPRPGVVGMRWTTRSQWHVTLRFLGRVDDALVPDVVEALSRAAPPVTPFVASLGPAVARFGQRVLHVPVSGLDVLAKAVVDATVSFGEPPEDRPFTGHLTLARVSRGARRVDLRPLCGREMSASWTVRTFELFRSDLHPQGARYSVVESFRLASDA